MLLGPFLQVNNWLVDFVDTEQHIVASALLCRTADFLLIRTLIVVCNPADAGVAVSILYNRVLSMSVIALSRRGLRMQPMKEV